MTTQRLTTICGHELRPFTVGASTHRWILKDDAGNVDSPVVLCEMFTCCRSDVHRRRVTMVDVHFGQCHARLQKGESCPQTF